MEVDKLDKVRLNLNSLSDAMSILEKSLELGQQTGRFRNIVTRNDMDSIVAVVASATKVITVDLIKSMEELA